VQAPLLQLSLLGRFELTGPDGPIDLTSKKLAALLAFLACTAPRQHSRDKLMTLLWGSHFNAQARQNLRQGLHRLRRVLGSDALVGSAESVFLRPGVIACDATRFEALLADGSRSSLTEAADLYRGCLLAEIAIPEESWTEWLEAQRQRLEGLALDAMVKLAEQELQLGNHERALKAARRAVACVSDREDAHRLIMRALAAGGRRADGPGDTLSRRRPARDSYGTVGLREQIRPTRRTPCHARADRGATLPARPTFDRRAAVRQHERRPGAGVFCGRHGR
jgi:DNA-binding SARP family transcriptional activator